MTGSCRTPLIRETALAIGFARGVLLNQLSGNSVVEEPTFASQAEGIAR